MAHASNNGKPRPDEAATSQPAESPAPAPERGGTLAGLVAEAEAIRGLLHDADTRLARLLAALKHQRKQSRAVLAAMASLRQLQHLTP